ncbi:MAG TPA: FKBP-type peptidyl-prolyl cis-trans isomerase [Phaeodactylibacter sp.]|nr:FKBP-type peptidyl-prolyl cis-trans isomerase [Phaeodactylibacter sp.]
MKNISIAFILFLCIQFLSCSPKKTAVVAALTPDVPTTKSTNMKIDSLSYSLGVLLAKNLQQQGFNDLNAKDLSLAISDVLDGKETMVNPNQANQIVMQYQQQKNAEREAQNAKKFAKNKEEGTAFLEKNKLRKEVTTTASGLQYEVLKQGDGAKPSATDRVKVHYHGTLIDGTVFDSSLERGQPATFGVNQVIQGWVEGLQLMNVGSKYKFYIPYNLAYGERSAGTKIGPFSTLIFEVELLGIE